MRKNQGGLMVRLKIKEIIDSRGISMAKLSRMADLNYNTVLELCRDPYHDAAISTLERIAQALKVPISEIMEEETLPPHIQ
jgi:transcriptional regulator with XRE-family HTH domain